MNPLGSSPIRTPAPISEPSGQTDTALAPSASGVREIWVWWHLLSLDAPTVAVVWCWFFAAVFHISLSWTALPTIAMGTWTVYVADRLLDGWTAANTVSLRDRHWFYLRHRKPFIVVWCLVSVPLAYCIFFRVPRAVRNDDIVLCLIGVAYFVLIHGSTSKSPTDCRTTRWRLSNWLTKELAVGFLFPVATAIPTWTRLSSERGTILLAVLVFGGACWLNCVAIQTWEDADVSSEVMHKILAPAVAATATENKTSTEVLGRHLSLFAGVVGVVAAMSAAVALYRSVWPLLWALFASVAISAMLFLILIRNRRFSTLTLRIAADAALLTPLLFLLWLK